MNIALKFTFLLFSMVLLFLSGCDSSSSEYFFQKPAALSVLKGAKCSDGSVSYMGFVVDNTDKYGARLMKISGCAEQIDKDFKDEKDDKTGIYISGSGVTSDQMIVDNEVILAVASSGYTPYEHWKDKAESKKLELHKGRIVLRKLGKDLKHDYSYNRSLLLDFYPSLVKAYKQDGFFFTGSNFGVNYLGFVDLNGKGQIKEIGFSVSGISVADEKVFLFDKKEGTVFSVDQNLMPEHTDFDDIFVNGGMSEINKNRIVLYAGNKFTVYTSDLKVLHAVQMPDKYEISSITSVEYNDELQYRKFSSIEMSELVKVYVGEQSDSDIAVDDSDIDNVPDSDVSDVSYADMDEVSDEDTVSEWEILNASDGDILWIASKSGNVMTYDLKNSSWLVFKYSDSNPDYYNEMRPYMSSTYITFPEFGDTNSSNVPFISSIYAVRGLPYSITYRLIFEGIIEGTQSDSGVLNEEKTVLKDLTVDFQKVDINLETDSVVLLNRISSNGCVIPLNKNLVMKITGVLSANELSIEIDKYKNDIEKCYGDKLNYAIFPNGKYAVSRESFSGVEFAGRGSEMSAKDKSDDFSFSDIYTSISIKRKSDDVVTEKETSFYIKLNPGVPFIGFNSRDYMTYMTNPSENRMLMFSPLTRRIVEYNIVSGKVTNIYK